MAKKRTMGKRRGMGDVMVNNERGVFGLLDMMKVLAKVLGNREFGKEFHCQETSPPHPTVAIDLPWNEGAIAPSIEIDIHNTHDGSSLAVSLHGVT
ncbi:hypothetical protein AHAS_Ahas03G0213000 [Arachis hypogaea]